MRHAHDLRVCSRVTCVPRAHDRAPLHLTTGATAGARRLPFDLLVGQGSIPTLAHHRDRAWLGEVGSKASVLSERLIRIAEASAPLHASTVEWIRAWRSPSLEAGRAEPEARQSRTPLTYGSAILDTGLRDQATAWRQGAGVMSSQSAFAENEPTAKQCAAGAHSVPDSRPPARRMAI